MEKIEVAYHHGANPNEKGITHGGIVIDRDPPYVQGTYRVAKGDSPPTFRASNVVVLPVREAEKLFHFKEGKLVDITRS